MMNKKFKIRCDYKIVQDQLLIHNVENLNKTFMLKGFSKDIFELIACGKTNVEIYTICSKKHSIYSNTFDQEYQQFIQNLTDLNIIETIG